MYRWIKERFQRNCLIDKPSGPKTKLRYVLMYRIPTSKESWQRSQLWNLPMEGENLVADYLQEQFNLEETEGGLAAEVLHQAAVESVQDWLPDAFDEMRLDVGELSWKIWMYRIRKWNFRELMINSTWYLLLNRCGLDVQEYLDAEDFRYITDFKPSESHGGHLGSSVNELAKPVLMQIGRYVMTDLEKI